MSSLAKSTDTESPIREDLIYDLIALEEYFGENAILAQVEECFDPNVLRILATAIAVQQDKLKTSLNMI